MTGLLEAIFSFLKRGILASVYIGVEKKKHILPLLVTSLVERINEFLDFRAEIVLKSSKESLLTVA